MKSKVVGAHIPQVKTTVPAGSLPAGTLVRIHHYAGVGFGSPEFPSFGLITGNLNSSVDLVSLSDRRTWSNLGTDVGPLVEPLPVGSQVVLEATVEEVPLIEPEETDDWGDFDWEDEEDELV